MADIFECNECYEIIVHRFKGQLGSGAVELVLIFPESSQERRRRALEMPEVTLEILAEPSETTSS